MYSFQTVNVFDTIWAIQGDQNTQNAVSKRKQLTFKLVIAIQQYWQKEDSDLVQSSKLIVLVFQKNYRLLQD